jgi:hypothetical protein
MACGDRKNTPGGPCCAPCDFGCDPCLCRIDIDAGACGGGVTLNYDVDTPCVGILTEIEPACVFEDCEFEPCIETNKTLVHDLDCVSEAFCVTENAGGTCTGTPFRYYHRRTRNQYKSWVHEVTHRQWQVQIHFLGLRQFKVKVTLRKVKHAYAIEWRRNSTQETAKACGTCPNTVNLPFVETIASETGDATGGTTICSWSTPTGDRAAVPCNVGDNRSNVGIRCVDSPGPPPYYVYTRGAIIEAEYEETFDLDNCEQWPDDYVLPRIDTPADASVSHCVLTVPCGANNALPNIELDDCLPSEVTVTLNSICAGGEA